MKWLGTRPSEKDLVERQFRGLVMSSTKQSSRMMQTSICRHHHYFLVRLMLAILLGMIAVYLHSNLNGKSSHDDVQGRIGIDKLLNEPIPKEESILNELALAETTQEVQEGEGGEGANFLLPSVTKPLPLASPSTKSAKAKGDSKSKGSKSKGSKSKSKGSKSKSKSKGSKSKSKSKGSKSKSKSKKHVSRSKSAKAKSGSKSKKTKSASKGSAKAGKNAEKSNGGKKSAIKSAKTSVVKDDLEFEDEMMEYEVVGAEVESFTEDAE